jgi:hypothetical protein
MATPISHQQQSPGRIKAFRALLARHNKFFTLLGAFVVFMTFVVKEGARERLKDKLDSIHSAVDVYKIRNESQIRADEIWPAEKALHTFKMTTDEISAAKAFDPFGPIQKGLDTITALRMRAQRSFENTSELIGRLPYDAQLNDSAKDLRHLSDVIARQYAKSVETYRETVESSFKLPEAELRITEKNGSPT